jgi:Crp-like helix-turn-helix domain
MDRCPRSRRARKRLLWATQRKTAITESVVVRLEKATILRVIHQEPAFAEMFIAHLLGRTIRVEADLVDQLFNSSEKRLARLLLLLANFGKEDKPGPMIAKISQETLAEMIGTTRSRVSFFMNKFRKLGFIDYNPSNRDSKNRSPSNGASNHRDRKNVDNFRRTSRSVTSSNMRERSSIHSMG